MSIFRFFMAMVLLGFGTTLSFACLCINLDTVCEAYENSEAIIVGKVVGFREISNHVVTNDFDTGQLVVLSITKAYKGNLRNSVEIWQPASSCDSQFVQEDIGHSFLLYLHRWNDPDRLTPISCGRNQKLKGGEGDISWLDNLPSSLERSFFYGSLREYAYDEEKWPRFKAGISNTRVELIGKNRILSRMSDENGFFEFFDLPQETYRLRINIDKRFRFENELILGFWDKEPEDRSIFDPLTDRWFEVDGEGCQEVIYDLIKGKKGIEN